MARFLSISLLALLLTGAAPRNASAGPEEQRPGRADSPAGVPPDLEGIAPGQTFDGLEPRWRLRALVPLEGRGERRYVLDVTRTLPHGVGTLLEARDIRRMEVVFREERVARVRVEYGAWRKVLFDEMGADLVGRFGEPTEIHERGPLQIGRSRGIRLYLWLRIWTWQGQDRSLTVEGRHFGVEKGEVARDHAYIFTLEALQHRPTGWGPGGRR